MNDRFKFRVWDKIHKRYIYCDFAGYCSVDYSGNGEKRIVFMPSGVEQIKNGRPLLYAKGDEAKIEQCTGLRDKNGKLIYEGDIVKIDEDLATIKWSIYSARFLLDSEEDFFSFDSCYTEDCEVIGNIHKNPELLELNNDLGRIF